MVGTNVFRRPPAEGGTSLNPAFCYPNPAFCYPNPAFCYPNPAFCYPPSLNSAFCYPQSLNPVYVYVYVYGGRLKGVQVVGKNVFPTTCTPFSRPPAHFWVLKVHFWVLKVHFWVLKVHSLSAEGGTSGRDKCFPPAAG